MCVFMTCKVVLFIRSWLPYGEMEDLVLLHHIGI